MPQRDAEDKKHGADTVPPAFAGIVAPRAFIGWCASVPRFGESRRWRSGTARPGLADTLRHIRRRPTFIPTRRPVWSREKFAHYA